jgi:predicted metal-binding protein
MARIGILNCSNASQELGCAMSACLADWRKKKGGFSKYEDGERIDLIGVINCPGCPTLTGTDKLMQRIQGLTAFRLDALHLSNCIVALCPFKMKYIDAIKQSYPELTVIEGTHQEHISREDFRAGVKQLFNQPRQTMTDFILGRL